MLQRLRENKLSSNVLNLGNGNSNNLYLTFNLKGNSKWVSGEKNVRKKLVSGKELIKSKRKKKVEKRKKQVVQ